MDCTKQHGILAIGLIIALAQAHASAQEPDLAELKKKASQARTDVQAQSAYGQALLRAGHIREAETQLRLAARVGRNSPALLFDATKAVFASGDARKGRAACKLVEKAESAPKWSHVCRARAFLLWNRSERAFEELEAILGGSRTECPANTDTLLCTNALLALGDAHRIRAQLTESQAAYEHAARLSPDNAEPHLGLGRLFASANRTDLAIASLRQALRLDPTSPDIQYELGHRLLPSTEGRDLLRQAVTGRPQWPDALVVLGEAEISAGNINDAQRVFEAAVRYNPRLPPAQEGLGQVYATLGNYEAAEPHLEQALELVPNAAKTRLTLGEVYEHQQRYEEALEQYETANRAEPSNPAGLIDAARLASRLHRNVLAAGYLTHLLTDHPNYEPALTLFGDVMTALGKPNEAKAYYDRAKRGSRVPERVQRGPATLPTPTE